ncbi:hypothetical protein DBR11_28275 [Pedobacter sp. HMWF019]|uniref:hypothetical protein n=1 Tax=Pedobacter sp. HMWF019 TaxID=2056856 RepID=UPI000D39E05C|nr:hypothetical protein [Pedobacter sp. HMWF019]PTS91856.1 hypothetical protein DBR11_28275 [Pedobacter sp. HMWF019]
MLDRLEFKKVREFGEIINDTFLFIKQNFKPLLKVLIYLCGFFILAGMVAAITYQLSLQKNLVASTSADPYGFSRLSQVFSISYFMVIVLVMANYTSMYVATLSFIALYIEKGNVAPTVEEVWAYFKYYFFRVMGSGIVVGIFILLAFMCCFFPGVYVFPAMSIFYPIMVLENGTLGYSFNRSFKLLKDQWWTTAATIFVIWIIAYATMSFASLPAIILGLVGAFTSGGRGLSSTIVIISTIIQYVCQLFMVLPVIGVTLCYFNLTERQESTGLMNRIDQFGTGEKDLNSTPEEY